MKLLLFWKLHQWLLLVPLATLKLHSACAPWLMYGPSICPKNAVVVSIRIGMYLNSDAILFYCQTRRPRVTVCSRNIIRSCVGGHFVKMMIDGIWELLWGYIIYITISACLPSDQQKSHQHVCFHWSKLPWEIFEERRYLKVFYTFTKFRNQNKVLRSVFYWEGFWNTTCLCELWNYMNNFLNWLWISLWASTDGSCNLRSLFWWWGSLPFVYFENSCEIVFLYKYPMELVVIKTNDLLTGYQINLKLTPRRQYKIDIQRDAIFVRCIANVRFTCNHQVQVPEEGFHQVQQEVEWWFGQEEHWKWLPQDAPLLQSYSCYCPHSGNYQ